MSRSLYISQANKPVVMRDGPSIWVREEGRAGRRIPVRLVSRVVIIGNVTLDAGTVTLFAENNVPITFITGRNTEAAVALPYNHRLPEHYAEQRILLESETNIEHYRKWTEAKRSLIQMRMLRRFFPDSYAAKVAPGLGSGNYDKLFASMKKGAEEQWYIVSSFVLNIFRTLIIERIVACRLDPHFGVIHRRHNFGLALDICYMIGGEGDMQTIRFFSSSGIGDLMVKQNRQWVLTSAGIKNIIHRFENRREVIKDTVENILDELFVLMREMIR